MRVYAFILLAASFALFRCSYFAEPAENITVAALFSDNMVLQQNTGVPVWGTASQGKVTVEILGQRKGTTVDPDGRWQVELDEMTAGGPYDMLVIGQDTTVFTNVMIGEVWICSGQSNMEMPMDGRWGASIVNSAEEISNAVYSNIRLFTVEKTTSTQPLDTLQTTGWHECSPETVKGFSATAYFFGRHLHNTLNVPIGLIHSSWGGTPAEAWTTAEFLKEMPDYAERVEQIAGYRADSIMADYEKDLAAWQNLVDEKTNEALAGGDAWESADLDVSDWKAMDLPVLWEQAGLPAFDGIVWFRTTFTLAEVPQDGVDLYLGAIDDSDVTFVNGEQVGSTDGYNLPRAYNVPANVLTVGENSVAVKVIDTGGGGGLWGVPEELYVLVAGEKISLAKPWYYMPGVSFGELPPQPQSPDSPHRPTVLYNGMINPVIPYAIQGAIWYQGEANASRAYQYQTLFPTMIKSWRDAWGIDFPFYFVQLANFHAVNENPVDSDWAELREAQTMTLALPNTGMAVTIDIGEADDIHPGNKQDVGKRLALNARALTYGENIVYSGPMYRSMKINDDKVILTFDNVGSGLMAQGDKLTGFAIAGEDKKFVWADAVIEGETIVVSSPKVEKPHSVRYAWADNPECNLYNKEGLPASPFRTDDWPGITVPRSVK